MTRKLLVPLFAISMAAFGCGSDSDDTTPDAGKTDTAADAVKTDTLTPPTDGGADTQVGTDGSVPDAPVSVDAGPDAAITDAPIQPDAGVDGDADAADGGSDASNG